MCFKMCSVVLFVVILTIKALPLVPGQEECGIEASPHLVHHNPWLVYIEYFHGKRLLRKLCGGTLIDSTHIVTAAHCIKSHKFTYLKVRLGEYDVTAKQECVEGVCTDRIVEIDVEEIIIHPDYDGKEHDIAVLRLKKKAPYTEFIRPACLPTGRLAPDATFIATGWGVIPHRGEYSHIKKIIPLPYVDTETCQKGYKKNILPKSVICAGGKLEDTCSGDSGGPLVWYKDRAELWGVTSAGNVRCGTEGTPGIYTSVVDYLDWINEVLAK